MPFQIGTLCLARVEPKVKAFAWTAMHMKILTTDNLAVRESSTAHYAPYVATPKDTDHLLIGRSFSKEVLRLLWVWYQF
jgi:hypothetical protein